MVELLVLFGDTSVQEVTFDRRFGGADVDHDFHGCLQLGHDVLRSLGDEVLFVGEGHPEFGQVAGGIVSLEEGVAVVQEGADVLGSVVEGGVEVTLYLPMRLLQVLLADGEDELICLLGGFFGGGGGHGEGGSRYLLHKHQVVQTTAHFVADLIVDILRARRVQEEVVNAAGVVKDTIMVAVERVCAVCGSSGPHVDGVTLCLMGVIQGAVCFVGKAVSGLQGSIPVSSNQKLVVEVLGVVDLVLDVLVDLLLGRGFVPGRVDANDVDARVGGWEGDVG